MEKDAAEGLQAADGAAARTRARPLLLRPDIHCRAPVRFPNPTIACCFWMEEEETLPMGPQPSALDPPASGSWKPTMRFLSDITRTPPRARKFLADAWLTQSDLVRCRSLAHSLAPGRDSQRISLRASQAQQLGRESLFDGFTYLPGGSSLLDGSELDTSLDPEDL